MSKFEKIFSKGVIIINVLAGLVSIICHNYVLGMNQLLVAWFAFLYYNEMKK
jgi:hypothetical protein